MQIFIYSPAPESSLQDYLVNYPPLHVFNKNDQKKIILYLIQTWEENRPQSRFCYNIHESIRSSKPLQEKAELASEARSKPQKHTTFKTAY